MLCWPFAGYQVQWKQAGTATHTKTNQRYGESALSRMRSPEHRGPDRQQSRPPDFKSHQSRFTVCSNKTKRQIFISSHIITIKNAYETKKTKLLTKMHVNTKYTQIPDALKYH